MEKLNALKYHVTINTGKHEIKKWRHKNTLWLTDCRQQCKPFPDLWSCKCA